jgi:cysteine-rich repeat protein
MKRGGGWGLVLITCAALGCSAPSDGAGRDAGTRDGASDAARDAADAADAPAPVCGNGIVEAGEACDDGANADRFDGCLPDCTAWPLAMGTPLDPTPDRTWQWIPIEGARCRNGSQAGFGLSRSSGSRNLMIYLEGGGACFNSLCDVTAFDTPFVPPIDGIFDRLGPGNPVAEWNMVYVPYCTGDVHAGDATDVVIDTATGPITSQFVGYRNIGLFLERLVPTFRDADQVLLTGISAGGFGAALNGERTQEAFGPVPVILLDDSGPPMSTAAIPTCLQHTFRTTWNFDATFLALCGSDCPNADDWVLDYLHHVEGVFAHRGLGLVSNTQDMVIRTFYGFGANDCMGGVVDGTVYQNELLAIRADRTPGDLFGTYYVTGIGHTFLRTPSFYLTGVGGTPLTNWVADLLAGHPTQVGP